MIPFFSVLFLHFFSLPSLSYLPLPVTCSHSPLPLPSYLVSWFCMLLPSLSVAWNGDWKPPKVWRDCFSQEHPAQQPCKSCHLRKLYLEKDQRIKGGPLLLSTLHTFLLPLCFANYLFTVWVFTFHCWWNDRGGGANDCLAPSKSSLTCLHDITILYNLILMETNYELERCCWGRGTVRARLRTPFLSHFAKLLATPTTGLNPTTGTDAEIWSWEHLQIQMVALHRTRDGYANQTNQLHDPNLHNEHEWRSV